MNEAKHTPGPWAVIDGIEGGWEVWANRPGGSGCILASRSPWPHYAEASAANARLIAAAPDFADAAPDAADLLEHYAEYIRSVHSSELERHPYLPLVEDAARGLRAAIAKATGAA